MTVQICALVVDCKDPSRVAGFWHALLGGELVPFEDHDVVALRAPGVTFDFVAVPDSKHVKNRWHPDLATDDPAGAIARVVELGGTRAPDIALNDRFTVMRDVEGNEFCVMNYQTDGPWVPPSPPADPPG